MTERDQHRRRDLLQAAHRWRARMAAGHASEDDQRALDAWLAEDEVHRDAYDEAQTYWSAYGALTPGDIDPDLLRPSWPERLTEHLTAWGTIFRRRRLSAAFAAFCLVVAGAAPFLASDLWTPRPTDASAVVRHATAAGETRSIRLGDGTVLTLGARSEVDIVFTPEARQVRLASGTALFDVAKDGRPFTVKAGQLTARVLGTVFEVRASGDVTRTLVAEGRVAVTYPLLTGNAPSGINSRAILTGGEQVSATAAGGLGEVSAVSTQHVGAWRQGLLTYEGATLSELVADIARYTDRPLLLGDLPPDVAGRRVNASLRAEDVGGMLELLAELYPVLVEDSGEALRIEPLKETLRPR